MSWLLSVKDHQTTTERVIIISYLMEKWWLCSACCGDDGGREQGHFTLNIMIIVYFSLLSSFSSVFLTLPFPLAHLASKRVKRTRGAGFVNFSTQDGQNCDDNDERVDCSTCVIFPFLLIENQIESKFCIL